MVKRNPSYNARDADVGLIPRSRIPSREGNSNPLQYFAWKVPWTKEPGRLQSMGSQRVGHH